MKNFLFSLAMSHTSLSLKSFILHRISCRQLGMGLEHLEQRDIYNPKVLSEAALALGREHSLELARWFMTVAFISIGRCRG